MSDYDLNKLANSQENMPNNEEPEKQPQLLMAFLAGLGASVIVGGVLALLGILLEAEYIIFLIIGGIIVGLAITHFVPHKSIGGAVIGFILCPITYVLYQFIMNLNGYEYEKDGNFTFWFSLIGSAIYGAYMGYNKKED
jgi:hypothetical protein